MDGKTDYIVRYWFYDEVGQCVRSGYSLQRAYVSYTALAVASSEFDQMPEYLTHRIDVKVQSVAEILIALETKDVA